MNIHSFGNIWIPRSRGRRFWRGLFATVGLLSVLFTMSSPMLAQPALAGSNAQFPLSSRHPVPSATTVVVNRSDDTLAGLQCSGIAGASDCSLRGALGVANQTTFANIRFDSSLSSTPILPISSLPPITAQGTWIDGSTASGAPVTVLVDGHNIPSGDVFTIQANAVTISKLGVNNAPSDKSEIAVVSGNDARIAYDTLGFGSIACLNLARKSGFGIYISSTGGLDGGPDTAYIYGDTIGCHASQGIWVNGGNFVAIGLQPDGTTVTGNNIGTDGTNSAGNGINGILLTNAYTSLIEGNLISGNGGAGIALTGTGTKNTSIGGNVIGLAGDGHTPMGNAGNGVLIINSPLQTSLNRNTISGNGNFGVDIGNSGGSDLLVGNLIGLTTDGMSAAPNTLAGVAIIGDTMGNNSIGKDVGPLSAPNYISGNQQQGIYVEASSGWVIANSTRIGVASNSTTPAGNAMDGILVKDSTALSIYPSINSNNHGAGIDIVGTSANVNLQATLPVTITNNGGLPIVSGELGVPRIASGNGNNVTGTACANCRVDIYRAVGNPAAAGGGGIYLQSTLASASGTWSAVLPAGITRNDIAAVATDPSGNSSQMSARSLLLLPLIVR